MWLGIQSKEPENTLEYIYCDIFSALSIAGKDDVFTLHRCGWFTLALLLSKVLVCVSGSLSVSVCVSVCVYDIHIN